MPTADGFWFEDVFPGRVLRSARAVRMDGGAIAAFARQFDLHPAHLSEETAAASMFGVSCASGWHTGAVTMRLISETMPIARGGTGAGIERLSWLRPVRPGDDLTIEIEILAARVSRSRPDAGVVTYRCTTLNQEGAAVQQFTTTVLFPCRNDGAV
ncbi:MAG: MaoC family dehydratase N-terminal domain-containing protein [Pseudomonadota bacterium]|nr:MaoC family dehydratase N-terminal domain-containing protein [Pseudomonadota bacterium]